MSPRASNGGEPVGGLALRAPCFGPAIRGKPPERPSECRGIEIGFTGGTLPDRGVVGVSDL